MSTTVIPDVVNPRAMMRCTGAGATAFFGMVDIGRPRPGKAVVVSAAAGAAGSLAGQDRQDRRRPLTSTLMTSPAMAA